MILTAGAGTDPRFNNPGAGPLQDIGYDCLVETPKTRTGAERRKTELTGVVAVSPTDRTTQSSPRDDSEGESEFVSRALDAEARAIDRLFDEAEPDLESAIDLLESCEGLVVATGMGKSGLIAQKTSATLSSVGVPSHFLHPAEAVHGDLGRIRRDDVVWAFSYSGNTQEVAELCTLVKQDGVRVLGMSSNRTSRLASIADAHLCIGDVTEACPLNLAPTASTTAMLALADAVSLAVSRRRDFTAEEFQKRHPGGMLGVSLRPVTEMLRFRVGKNLPLIESDMTVREALDHADTGRRPGALLVVDSTGRLAGIFTDGDLRRLIMREGDAGLARSISDVMTASPRHLTTNHLVRDTVQLVREFRQDEIPVVDQDGKPLGLIDVQDLVALKVIEE